MDFSKINLEDHQELARYIVLEAIKANISTRNDFQKFRNVLVKQKKGTIFHNLYFIKAYNDLLKEGKIKDNPEFLALIQKRSVRTMSGVAPVTVLTKPYPCPGKCVYCPTDVRMPKSYLPSQPAAQRGFRQRFDPYTQVYVRLKALQMTGHQISKIELRTLGGTWSAYPKRYQTWFLKRCLQAMNEFHEKEKKEKVAPSNILKTQVIESVYGEDEINTLLVKSISRKPLKWEEVVKENETGDIRCIGINVETRPDHITKQEVKRLRYLGVTKIEMGVQSIYDEVSKKTKRGQTVQDVIRATKLLKDAGFKVSYHMMPNLPGSTPKKDIQMVRDLFVNPDFQPDYLKVYPCVVMPRTALALEYRKGNFEPYTNKQLENILYENLRSIPEWCRVDRVARDIPSTDIEAGFKTSNMRQILEKKLVENGTPPKDIRSREVQNIHIDPEMIDYVIRSYPASGGVEHFLSYEDSKNDKLIALLRLRFSDGMFIKEIQDTALIREVHVYGKQVAVGKKGSDKKQHAGWGRKLMQKAEDLTRKKGYKKIAVIAGIGTREYYRKWGYTLKGTYMVKHLL